MKISMRRTIQTAPYETKAVEIELEETDLPPWETEDPMEREARLQLEVQRMLLRWEYIEGHITSNEVKERWARIKTTLASAAEEVE